MVISSTLKRVGESARKLSTSTKVLGVGLFMALFVAPLAMDGVTGPAGVNDDILSEPSSSEVLGSMTEGTTEAGASVHSSNSSHSDSHRKDGEHAADVNVTVNGEEVPVPDHGSVHEVLSDNENRTVVDINVNGSSTSTSHTHTSTTIKINSNTSTSGDEQTNTRGGNHPPHPPR